MTKITAIIPTLNEEMNVANALESVTFADEIIVIDSYSSDKTLEIAQSYNVRIIQREFDDFSSQKNFAIDQASNDWIFLLDSDEVVSEGLQKEIIEKANNPNGFTGFYIYRKFFFKGKKLKHSGWRYDKVIRLFNKQFCHYEGKVHEKIVSTGVIGFLKNKILHYSLKNIDRYKSKLNFYAILQAEELYEKGKVVNAYHFLIKPSARFFIQYFIKLGFLDGYYGFTICKLHAHGVYLRYKKLLELRYRIWKKKNVSNAFKFKYELDKDNSLDISVVIVNYKSWNYLNKCLSSLDQFEKSLFSYEVLVVDNNSNDGKLEEYKSKYKNVQFIENTGNNGFANGCNVGAREAKGNHLLFLNPDTIANEEALFKMLAYTKENEDVGIVSCLQKNDNGFYENIVRFFPSLLTLFGATRALYKFLNYKKLSSRYNSVEELAYPDWVSGSVVFINRDWFLKVNGWNEDFWMYYEDVDLSKEVKNQDGRVVLLESAEIQHSHGGASRINFTTASLTKTEVIISKHVYIHNHFYGALRIFLQFLVTTSNVISRIIFSALGVLLFFIPKMKLQLYIGGRVFRYYVSSIYQGTWLSPRSMNYKTKR
mgnify:CR=1 FL=1